jgi:hypothetical protein
VVKLLHTISNKLSDRDFDKLAQKIISSMYELEPGIENIYRIHIDIIQDEWHIEFVPNSRKVPIIKVNAYTSYNANNREILHVSPINIIKFPEVINLKGYDDALTSVADLNIVLDFLVDLYDFEYPL